MILPEAPLLTLHGLIQGALRDQPDLGNDAISDLILDDIRYRDDFLDLLRPSFVHVVANIRRKDARKAEGAAFDSLRHGGHGASDTHGQDTPESQAVEGEERGQSPTDTQLWLAPSSPVISEAGDQISTDTHSRSAPASEIADTPRNRRTALIESPEWRAWLDSRFSIQGFGYVSWGEATVEQHAQRIAQLRAHGWGVVQVIQRHIRAKTVLERHHAICLANLPDQTLKELGQEVGGAGLVLPLDETEAAPG